MTRRIFFSLCLTLAGLFVAGSASAATLSFSPSSASLKVGETITAAVRLNSGGQAINASEATLIFPTNLLELKSISKSGSIFTFWAVEPSGSNSSGRVYFSGGLPNPGYTGTSGTVIRVTWQAKAAGTAKVSSTGGKILANDGEGTNVLTSQGSASYTISAASPAPAPTPSAPPVAGRPTPNISSTTHPDQTAWSTSETATFQWSRPDGLLGVSYIITQDSAALPDESSEPNVTTATIGIPGDGLWYLVLRGRYSSGWSAPARYALRRDTTPPETFLITVERDRGLADPSIILRFSTGDLASGIDRYTVRLDNGDELAASSPYTLTVKTPGAHRVVVKAYDRAGLIRTAQADFEVTGYPAPVITSVTSPVILLDPVVITGTAQAGDLITVFVGGEAVGQTVVGTPGDANATVIVRLPWTLTLDRVFRPGEYDLTATARSPGGEVSVATDPWPLKVAGTSVLLGGRPIAIIAVAPFFTVVALVVLGLLLLTLFGLVRSVIRLHHRNELAQQEIEEIEHRLMRNDISTMELEADLEQVEKDLGRKKRTPKRKTTTRRKSTKR